MAKKECMTLREFWTLGGERGGYYSYTLAINDLPAYDTDTEYHREKTYILPDGCKYNGSDNMDNCIDMHDGRTASLYCDGKENGIWVSPNTPKHIGEIKKLKYYC